jgi:hypothetical protein
MNAFRVYGVEHKDRLKAYYENHKDEFAERHRQYYAINKTNILDIRKQKLTCDCGCVIRRGDMARHKRSKKHQELINNK